MRRFAGSPVSSSDGSLGPVPGLGYVSPVTSRPGSGFARDPETVTTAEAEVAEEVPVALVYAGVPHVVLMGTPADLEDLAVGFSLSEGLIETIHEVLAIEAIRHSRGIEVHLRLRSGGQAPPARQDRHLTSRTSCGICGVEAIEQAVRPPPAVRSCARFTRAAVWRASLALAGHQPLNERTRSVHGAAWADASGTIRYAREDVGRHNALDKVIGALARAGTDPGQGFALITSRASFEMVQKAATAGIPLLAAVSRPTGLAIDFAEASGLTLVGLLRGESGRIYAHPDRIE